MELFDTHTHLTDEAFGADRCEIINTLNENGVKYVTDVGCDLRDAYKSVELAEKYPFIYAAVGMHPHYASEMTDEMLFSLEKLLAHKKVVALGEIGLDYHYDLSKRDVQRHCFVQQLELAQQLNMPVVLHIREAFGDCMDILRAHKNGLKGVMHCYSGSLETARECVDMGLYIAFGGALTFKNAQKQLENICALPLDRIVLETDCPYLTPVPLRGKRNEPKFIAYTARKAAELLNMDVEDIAAVTTANAIKLFELDGMLS